MTPASLVEGQAFSGTVFHFTDANPAATASDYTAVVTLGDGNSVTLNSSGVVSGPAGAGGQIVADASGGFDVQLSYTYAEAFSNHTFSVSVTAVDGASTSASTANFSVADAPDRQQRGRGRRRRGGDRQQSPFSGATFTDANPGSHAGDFTATITWGDCGPTSPGTVSYDSSSGNYSVAGWHTYAKGGTFAISIAVVDAGGSTTTITGCATVAAPMMPYATATVVSSSANPSTFGQPATLIATVATTPWAVRRRAASCSRTAAQSWGPARSTAKWPR